MSSKMVQFKVSVPGNLRLFGEHVAKYGGAGLMSSIDLRTTLTFEETSDSSIFFHVQYPCRISQVLDAPFEKFLNFYNHCVRDIESLNGKVIQCIADLHKSPNHTMIVHAFYYLLIYIAYKEQIKIKPFTMQLSTEFLVDNEFACSASITVCLVVCLFKWSCLQKRVNVTFDDANIKKILSYATHYGEISSQSGIVDVFTCLHGSLTQYKNRRFTTALNSMPNMTILLVHLKQKQCLDAKVQVAELMNAVSDIPFRYAVHSICDRINDLTVHYVFQKLMDISKDKNLDPITRASFTGTEINVLGFYTRLSQNLLEGLNMSHPHLDKICSIARKYGTYGNYTNIGNDRFVYIWCPEHVDEPCALKRCLMDELTMQGFQVTETKFAHEGAKIESL